MSGRSSRWVVERRRPIVLHITSVEYSVTTLLLPQLDFLDSAGFDVRVACSPDGTGFGNELDRFSPTAIPFARGISGGVTGGIRSSRRVARLLDELKPDLIHLHSPSAALTVRSMVGPVLARQPVVYTVHGFPFLWRESMPLRDRVLLRAERLLSGRTDLTLFQSREDFDRARDSGFKGDLTYLGNGVGDEWFAVPPTRDDGGFTLLFVGRLVREKGILDLLEALESVPEVRLLIVGSRLQSERDDIRAELGARIGSPRLQGRVTELGQLTQPELLDVMSGVDGLVLPSYREGVPRSVIEAMAAGRPIIATKIRGSTELVEDCVNGYLVEVGDVRALAGAIRDLATVSVDARRRMGAQSRERALENNRESVVFGRLLGGYRGLGVHPGDAAET